MIRKTLEALALGGMSMMPTSAARHLLHLLGSQRQIADKWGYHIRPIHYYDPLPDFRGLTSEQIRNRRIPAAIDFHWDDQKALLTQFAERFGEELTTLSVDAEPGGFNFQNEYFANLDASIYYSLIRDLRPSRIIEIGAGYSTRIANKAIRRNQRDGNHTELICIEPYPQPRLTDAELQMTLVQKRVEELELEFFSVLEPGDILFIDSSHVAKVGGDVCREFLEILPSLKAGVWVHVHDIFFPFDYPADWLIQKRIAFNEQYLLEAFLSFNSKFSVRMANHWLSHDFPELVSRIVPGHQPPTNFHGTSSFWMRKEG